MESLLTAHTLLPCKSRGQNSLRALNGRLTQARRGRVFGGTWQHVMLETTRTIQAWRITQIRVEGHLMSTKQQGLTLTPDVMTMLHRLLRLGQELRPAGRDVSSRRFIKAPSQLRPRNVSRRYVAGSQRRIPLLAWGPEVSSWSNGRRGHSHADYQ